MIKNLIRAFFVFGFIYIFLFSFIPDYLKMLFKLIPMVITILIAFSIKNPISQKYKNIILIGLLFCAIGDYTLQWFLIGLTSFLIGHLFYIYAFSSIAKMKQLTTLQYVLILYAIVMIGFIGGTLFYRGETVLATMVILYILIIVTMGVTAASTKINYATYGALLFILSDSILAINKFIVSIPFSHQLIMITYYSAQLLIAISIRNKLDTLENDTIEKEK